VHSVSKDSGLSALEALTAVWLRIYVACDVMPFSLTSSFRRFERIVVPSSCGSRIPRLLKPFKKLGSFETTGLNETYTVSHARIRKSSLVSVEGRGFAVRSSLYKRGGRVCSPKRNVRCTSYVLYSQRQWQLTCKQNDAPPGIWSRAGH
jgi:hypothetical protein